MYKFFAKDFYGINQISDNLRIKRVWWYPPAFWGSCFILQKKGALGLWWTKSWIYVSVIESRESDYIEHWLRWKSGIQDS